MRISIAALGALLSMGGLSAVAQIPDAGRLLRENVPPPAPPLPPPALNLQPPPGAVTAIEPGGTRFTVTGLRIEGLSALNGEVLASQLPPWRGASLDLAGMRALAAQVQERVRAGGYPFARAYVPAQALGDGVLRIVVVEGRYGQVLASGAPEASAWLLPLRAGDPITGGPLERSLLLLQDLPGVEAQSVLSPGAAAGTGDLAVQVSSARRTSGQIGVDNHGNRYAGRGRVRGAIDVNSPFSFGDQLGIRASYSSEATWLASLAYSRPIGHDGLRFEGSLSRTDYQLGKEFASLGAHGIADVASAGLSYPLLRTLDLNVRTTAGLQSRRLTDERDATFTREHKRAHVLPLAISADRRDASGTTWGSVALSLGRLELGENLIAVDQATAQTRGSYQKVNLDLARIQALGPALSLYGRLSAQWASKNLDSSEKLALGGIHGVRGWPNGEATGDAGWLAQMEIRYRIGATEPYAFLDAGAVRINRNPWTALDNRRSISGAGMGVRWATGPWLLDALAAWRAGADRSTTEPGSGRMQGWASIGYRF